MNNNIIKKVMFLSLLSGYCVYLKADNVEPKCSKDVMTSLLELSPAKMYDSIVDAGAQAFADIDDLMKYGLSLSYNKKNKKHEVNKLFFAYWKGLTTCSHAYINQQIDEGKTYKIYKPYLQELTKAHELVQVSFDIIAKDFVPSEPQKENKQGTIENLRGRIELQLKKLENIQAFSLRTIVVNGIIPPDWKNNVPKDHRKILPDFSRIFDSYKKFKDEELKEQKNGKKAFATFLSQNNIKTDANVEKFLSNLEKFIYRLEEDHNAAWFGKSGINEKILLAKDILNKGLNYYPQVRTEQISAKLKKSTDRVSSMILGESTGLISVLKQLLDKINIIYALEQLQKRKK